MPQQELALAAEDQRLRLLAQARRHVSDGVFEHRKLGVANGTRRGLRVCFGKHCRVGANHSRHAGVCGGANQGTTIRSVGAQGVLRSLA
jgi:hypothetical protein